MSTMGFADSKPQIEQPSQGELLISQRTDLPCTTRSGAKAPAASDMH